jgi:tetratricopeptide (TPR) repeat protein
MQRFDMDLDVRGDTAAAIATLKSILEAEPFSGMEALNRPHLWFATWFARAGDRAAVEAMLAAYESEIPEPYRRGRSVENAYLLTEVSLSLSEKDPGRALELLRRVEPSDCVFCEFLPAAKVFDALGERDSAIAYFEGYLEASGAQRSAWDNENRGPTLERLAALHEEAGDLEKAAVYYARLVDLWSEADPELQPRVQAARTRLEQILRERG